jgi:hypothetical protein
LIVSSKEIEAGQAVYTPLTLPIYDWLALGPPAGRDFAQMIQDQRHADQNMLCRRITDTAATEPSRAGAPSPAVIRRYRNFQ